MNKIISKAFIIICFIFITNYTLAQTKIDSLKNKLKYSSVNEQIDIYYKLSVLYRDLSTDSALHYANIGLSVIDANHGLYKKYEFFESIGASYERIFKYKLAIQYYQQALEGFENANNIKRQLLIINNIGVIYGKTSYYDKALSYFQQSLNKSNQIKDTTQICTSLTNIGLVYQVMKDYKLALDNFQRVLNLANLINAKNYIAHALNDISNIYSDMLDYNKALDYQLKSLDILKKINNRRTIAVSTSGIGEIYKKLKLYDKALIYFVDAYTMSKDFDDNFLNAHILCNISDIYISKKNYERAKQYLDKAESLAIEAGDRDGQRDIFETYSRYYSEKNDYKKALEYYKRYKDINDSIFSNEAANKIAELQVKSEIDEKDKENEILRQKTEIQQLAIHKQIYLRNTFIYISVIISLLVVFVLFRYWLKRRANKLLSEKNEFINKQKDELEEVYKTKDKLFSVITHDLKNPFSTLVTLSTFMENNYHTLEDDHKFSGIQSMKSSIINVYELLKNLTDWLNSKGNNLILYKTNFNLTSTIYSVVELYKIHAEQKSIDLRNNVESDIYVYGDERMIKTVLRNLIDNALKFTPVNGKIVVKTKEDKNIIIVSVTDNGVGISDTDKDKLFDLENSFSTHGTQYEAGGGLGLILSKEFIEKNDGDIWFESELKKGSAFYFTVIKAVNNE